MPDSTRDPDSPSSAVQADGESCRVIVDEGCDHVRSIRTVGKKGVRLNRKVLYRRHDAYRVGVKRSHRKEGEGNWSLSGDWVEELGCGMSWMVFATDDGYLYAIDIYFVGRVMIEVEKRREGYHLLIPRHDSVPATDFSMSKERVSIAEVARLVGRFQNAQSGGWKYDRRVAGLESRKKLPVYLGVPLRSARHASD